MHRAILVDSSRHFQPIAVMQTMIDAMAMAKLNVFHWCGRGRCDLLCVCLCYPVVALLTQNDRSCRRVFFFAPYSQCRPLMRPDHCDMPSICFHVVVHSTHALPQKNNLLCSLSFHRRALCGLDRCGLPFVSFHVAAHSKPSLIVEKSFFSLAAHAATDEPSSPLPTLTLSLLRHIVDSQSFPFNSTGAPKLNMGAWNYRETYSPADLKALVSYAADRGVRIMVEIDTPGASCGMLSEQLQTATGLWGVAFFSFLSVLSFLSFMSSSLLLFPFYPPFFLLFSSYFSLLHCHFSSLCLAFSLLSSFLFSFALLPLLLITSSVQCRMTTIRDTACVESVEGVTSGKRQTGQRLSQRRKR